VDIETITAGTYQILEHTVSAKEAIQTTTSPNVDIIPAHIDLVAIEIELVDKQNREYMLRKSLEEVKDDYDFLNIYSLFCLSTSSISIATRSI
jgi:chromosome partitioning protein